MTRRESVDERLAEGVPSIRTEDEFTVQGSRLYIQDTEPTDPNNGDVWIDIS